MTGGTPNFARRNTGIALAGTLVVHAALLCAVAEIVTQPAPHAAHLLHVRLVAARPLPEPRTKCAPLTKPVPLHTASVMATAPTVERISRSDAQTLPMSKRVLVTAHAKLPVAFKTRAVIHVSQRREATHSGQLASKLVSPVIRMVSTVSLGSAPGGQSAAPVAPSIPAPSTATVQAPANVTTRVTNSAPAAQPAPVSEPYVSAQAKSVDKPDYPPQAREREEEGDVVLLLTVDAAGRVANVAVKRGSGYRDLDRAAREAAHGWLFIPAHRGDQTEESTFRRTVRFRLTD